MKCLASALAAVLPLLSAAQNVAPNSSFEFGTEGPNDWNLSSGMGSWETFGRVGARSVSITGSGSTQTRWLTYNCPLQQGQTYAVRFWSCSSNALSGSIFGGFNTAYHDFSRPQGNAWTPYSLVARLPDKPGYYLNFGQTLIKGAVLFDEIEVYPTTPVHVLANGHPLGAGENLRTGTYQYQSQYAASGGSYGRSLAQANCDFAGFRFYMNNGSQLVYRHEHGGLLMTSASVRGGIWNYNGLTNNTLIIEASTNGTAWAFSGVMSWGSNVVDAILPPGLFPTKEVYVRLRSTNSLQFSLTNYLFSATTPSNMVTIDGATSFFEQREAQSSVAPLGIVNTTNGQMALLSVGNPGPGAETFLLTSSASQGGVTNEWNSSASIPAGQTNTVGIYLPVAGVGLNESTIKMFTAAGSNIFSTFFTLTGAQVPVPSGSSGAGNLAPNPSFELGATGPSSWSGFTAWETAGHTGGRSASISSDGGGMPRLLTYNCPIQVGETYSVRYWTKSSNAVSGGCFSGFNSVYRDFPRPPDEWVHYSMVATIPQVSGTYLNLGQVTLNGTIFYDDVEVYRTKPVYKQVPGVLLGSGETLAPGKYSFRVPFASAQRSDYAGNHARGLWQANTSFAGFRWYMNPGSSVIYRHEIGGLIMTNAVVVPVILNYNNITGVTLEVDASADGVNWQAVGMLGSGATSNSMSLPPTLFPASEIYVRLKSSNPVQFSLSDYRFSAAVPNATIDAFGRTFFMDERHTNTLVSPEASLTTVDGLAISLLVENPNSTGDVYTFYSEAEIDGVTRSICMSTNIPAGPSNWVSVLIPSAGFGENTVVISVTNAAGREVGRTGFNRWVSILEDDSVGARLASPASASLWWCTGVHKVGRTQPQPLATNEAIFISAARNEYEPFQLVLRPRETLTNVSFEISDLVCSNSPGQYIAASNVSACLVEYVPVTELYNSPDSSIGDTPDPLSPILGPIDAPAHTNTPVWFTVHVPKNTSPGIYEGRIDILSSQISVSVPICLRVRAFGLSDATHTDQVANCIIDNVWNRPTNAAQTAAVWDLYLDNMRRHRVAPYMPHYTSPIGWTYQPSTGSFTYSFDGFDLAMERYIEDFRFSSFKDVNEARSLPDIAAPGATKFTAGDDGINPVYRALYIKLMQPIAQHFREQGWEKLAYSFWIDEPPIDTSATAFKKVKDGMRMVQEAAPDLRRLQSGHGSDFPKPALYGDVEIWVPAFFGFCYKPERNQERSAAGESVWPYCGAITPQPWPNYFIDQPAANPRARQWIEESHRTDGSIYWGINYFYPPRNPWTTPMCFLGTLYLGNGDGSLVYPPTKTVPSAPVIAGPVDSIRWEMIREGIEDREYFWTFEQVIRRAESQLGTNHPSVMQAYQTRQAALDWVSWPPAPAKPYRANDLLVARELIANGIEALDSGAPIIADQPYSKTAPAGSSRRIQAEFLGWPLPEIQWQHEGTNLPGATSWRLVLTNLTSEMGGEYRAIASNSAGSITSAVSRVNVLLTNQAPTILKGPVSLSVTNGGRAVFGAGVSSLTPITYQWFHNGSALVWATNVTVLLTNLTHEQLGIYSVVASNAWGAVTSPPASLNFSLELVITGQPTNRTVYQGENAQFAVAAASSSPLSYQWFFNGTNSLSGQIDNQLILTNVQLSQAGGYHVVVSNAVGSVTSVVATLTVQTLFPPAILVGPTNVSVIEGQSANFSVSATGSPPLSYQWLHNLTNAVLGASGSILVVTNVQQTHVGSYAVVVTNIAGAITSAPAMLQIAGMPSYTTEPPGVATVWQGNAAVLVLAPDNRTRTVLVSSNLLDWEAFHVAEPTAAQVNLPLSATNHPFRFFRLRVEP